MNTNDPDLKKFSVKVTSNSFHSTIYHIDAYSAEHAEEKAWLMCGGPSGFAAGLKFKCLGKVKS